MQDEPQYPMPGPEEIAQLARRIDQGRGLEPADLVLKGGTVWCMVTGARITGDVAICGDMIVGIGAEYQGKREIDVTGATLVPGFIDTHLHVESSCVTPLEFDRCVTPRGITTAICDPHEIANVIGTEGVRYFLDASQHMLMDLPVNLSSCVPSSPMETSGATLEAADLLDLADHPAVISFESFADLARQLADRPRIAAMRQAAWQGRSRHAAEWQGPRLCRFLEELAPRPVPQPSRPAATRRDSAREVVA